MKRQTPSHTYIARKYDCGCIMALVVDNRDRSTGQHVASFIADGLVIERVTWQEWIERISQEPTLMKCPHGQLGLPGMTPESEE